MEGHARADDVMGAAPAVQAAGVFGTLTRLEYESLVVPPDQVDARRIRREVRRLLGWIARAD